MKKNQIIILAAVVVLIVAGIIGWALIQKSKISPKEEKIEEVFSLQAIVSSVDTENSFLTVKPLNQEMEIKVIVSDTTKLVRVELPFDPENPPRGTQFTPIQTEAEFSDFKVGDNIFIKTAENIVGKTEFGSVDSISILP